MRGYPNNPVACTGCGSDHGARKDGLCSRCRCKKWNPRVVKYPFRQEDDAYLRRIYADHANNRRALSAALLAFAKRLGYDRGTLTVRAQTLGITVRQEQREWTEAERQKLRELAGVLRPLKIARRMKRSYPSVVCQMKVLSLSSRITEGYSRVDVCQVLGVCMGTVQQWISRKYLRVTEATDRISEREILRFLREHADQYDLRRVDQAWFKGMIFPGTFGMNVFKRAAPASVNRESEERMEA